MPAAHPVLPISGGQPASCGASERHAPPCAGRPVAMLSISAAALAFNAPVLRPAGNAVQLRMGVADMEGTGPETGGKVFDPYKFSKIASEETLAWYRACELKHSRVAMAAVTGWAWVSSGGPLFPGYLSIEQGVTFESLGRDGYAAWDAVPEAGKLQIIGVVGILDLLGEASVKPHYMMGGVPGKIPLLWGPLGFTKGLSPETLARKRTAELKNGRLAMIGVMSFVSAHYIPDSVPLLP